MLKKLLIIISVIAVLVISLKFYLEDRKDLIPVDEYPKYLIGEWRYCDYPGVKFIYNEDGTFIIDTDEKRENLFWRLEGNDIIVISNSREGFISKKKISKFKKNYYETYFIFPPAPGGENKFCRII